MVDEMVVPVAVVIDATEAPFRSDGISWSVGLNFAGAVGNYSSVGIVAQAAASAVVKQVIITNGNATAQPYALIILGSSYLAADAISTERSFPATGANIPIDISSTDLGAAALPAGTLVLAQFWLPATSSLVVPVDVLLSGQVAPGNNPGLAVAVLGAGSAVAASFSGKYYTPLVNPAG